MTRDELATALRDAGHHYLDDDAPGTANRLIHEACGELVREHIWTFRLVTEDITPGVALTGLGPVAAIYSASGGARLQALTFDEVLDAAGGQGITTTGEPTAWYPDGWEQIATYPASSAPLRVRHYSRTAWVEGSGRVMTPSSGTATPVVAEDFHDIIVLRARIKALENTDESGLRNDLSERLQDRMAALEEQALETAGDVAHVGEWA